MPVHAKVTGRRLLLTIENPPVNALSRRERSDILEFIGKAGSSDIDMVILTGAGKTFCSGADIGEFGKPSEAPHLPDVINAIESCPKPVVAVITGGALGAGLELALGCHFRICSAGAKLGLPEVTLGIVPGAGGTQRLPRLINPLTAAQMIATGKPIDTKTALSIGLVDIVVEGDTLTELGRHINQIADMDLDSRRLSVRSPSWDSKVFEGLVALKREVNERARGAVAPALAVGLVLLAGTLPWTDAIEEERATFLKLRGGAEAAAMRHIFFAERAAAKPVTPVSSGSGERAFDRVGIIGAGTMGSAIAMNVADAGLKVILVEQSAEALARGMERISASYHASSKRGKLQNEEAERRIAAIEGSTSFEVLGEADLIIEAAFEDMEVKKAIFSRLDVVARRGAILATNTSYLDVNIIAAATERPADVIGLHYFSPANVMPLLEVVRASQTSPAVVATALTFARKTGKTAVVSGVCHGFIGNRMLRAYSREAGLLILEGATPSQVDAALSRFGMAMGPFAVADLAGIDIGFKARQAMAPGTFEPAATQVHDGLVAAGMLGQKTGAGFYVYDADNRGKCPNPLVDQLILQARSDWGITSRHIEDTEIVERCVFALANEALHIVDEGIASCIGDTDVVYVNGYGFPRHRGGPAYYAKQIGFSEVLSNIEKFQKGAFGRWWQPASALSSDVESTTNAA